MGSEIHILIFVVHTKLRHALDRFSVHLKRAGRIEFNGDVLARAKVDVLDVLGVLTLEERGEDEKRLQSARAVYDARGDIAVAGDSVLLGAGHNSAAVEAAVHRGRDPDLFICAAFAVDSYRTAAGLVFAE